MTRLAFVKTCRVVAGLMLAGLAWLFVGAALTPLPKALDVHRAGTYGPSIQVLDRNGELLREVRADDDGARAVWVPLDEMGVNAIDAVIAAEDRRFGEHIGVDPSATLRAIGSSLKARRVVSGASTITMQLARVVEPHPRTFRGKLGEMAMAVRIEASLSKREILEQYMNRAPFGERVRGIGAASRYFFDKPPRELSLAEAATLASIPRGPSYYSLTKHPERVLRRRDRVLDRMLANGAIDREQHGRAKAEPLTLQVGKGGFGAPHLVDALLSGTLDPSLPALRGKTARIETTVDRSLEREVELAAAEIVQSLDKKHVTAASVLVVDNASGDILAYVGSPRWDDDARLGKNDGVRALRQPGSTLKPFVYGLAMEELGWTPATVLPDVELHLDTPRGPYSPRNYDERFHGPVRLREALASSYNVPAVFAASEVGVSRVLDRLHAVGLSSLDESPEFYGPAVALGDGEVRLYDLVNAYATLARGGIAKPLRAVRGGAPGQERRVMPAAQAEMITDILRDRAARVSAFGDHSALDLPFEVAAKTGTSKGYRDNWTVGYTNEVTVGVWVGNFDGSAMTKVSGITGAAPLFALAMSAAMRGREHAGGLGDHDHDLGGTEHVSVCALSGGRPGPGCTHTVTEIVPKGKAITQACTMHETVKIDIRNGLRATPSCPAEVVRARVFERFDGPFAAWAHASGRSENAAPLEESPLCPKSFGSKSVARGGVIRYPHDGARFAVDPDRPLGAQSIPLKVDAPQSSAVAIYVDGHLAGRSQGGSPVYWGLVRGAHAIALEVDGERRDEVGIVVE